MAICKKCGKAYPRFCDDGASCHDCTAKDAERRLSGKTFEVEGK